MRRARLLLSSLIVATLVAVLAAPAVAAPLPQATDTPTPTETLAPTATATPAVEVVATVQSGGEVVIERRGTWGELAVFSALVVLIASLWLQWLYEQVQRFTG